MGGRTKLIKADEAAEILGLTRATVYQLLEKGTIPGKKIGGHWRIVEEELWESIRKPQKS